MPEKNIKRDGGDGKFPPIKDGKAVRREERVGEGGGYGRSRIGTEPPLPAVPVAAMQEGRYGLAAM